MKITINKIIILFILFVVLYHSFLMRMMPWSTITFSCDLGINGIKTYKVPKNIKLKIYGLGFGSFLNEQYYGKRSFIINSNGGELRNLKEFFFGGNYTFETPYRSSHPQSKWGYTHSFDISASDVIVNKKNLNFRTLILNDIELDNEPDPVAFWECTKS